VPAAGCDEVPAGGRSGRRGRRDGAERPGAVRGRRRGVVAERRARDGRQSRCRVAGNGEVEERRGGGGGGRRGHGSRGVGSGGLGRGRGGTGRQLVGNGRRYSRRRREVRRGRVDLLWNSTTTYDTSPCPHSEQFLNGTSAHNRLFSALPIIAPVEMTHYDFGLTSLSRFSQPTRTFVLHI